MIEKGHYRNGAEETFWKLSVPEEHVPGGFEVSIKATAEGIEIGDGLIPWADIDAARAALSETSHQNAARSTNGETDMKNVTEKQAKALLRKVEAVWKASGFVKINGVWVSADDAKADAK